GHEYLLGFGPDNSPIFTRRQADGTFEPFDDVWRASKVAITQIGHTGRLVGPGMGKNTWLWGAFRAALEAFPPIPTWPHLSACGRAAATGDQNGLSAGVGTVRQANHGFTPTAFGRR